MRLKKSGTAVLEKERLQTTTSEATGLQALYEVLKKFALMYNG
jgi:hypothetical protein